MWFIVNPETDEFINIIKKFKSKNKEIMQYSSNVRKNVLNNFNIKIINTN